MSRSVENYGIQMEFDNKDFEKGVDQTLSTLDRLKKKLNFDGASKGLEDLGYAAEKVNFNPLSKAVDGVQNGFSALEVVATGALLKIGSRVEELGEKLLRTATAMSALSPTNILSGWEKFGSKTTSVGTLVAQGNDIDYVNDKLSKLQWYADETSYAYTDMTSNIAKFTAAGQDLDSSTTALMGISNWAAMAGQNAQTASRAYYQLSQAMGKGVMRLDDWKSIQNASMDTAEFRQMALDAAVALGTLRKVGDNAYESLANSQGAFTREQFSAHLTEDAWFTSDVMMSVFSKYAEAIEPIYAYAREYGTTASEAMKVLEQEGALDEFAIRAFRAAQEARTLKDAIDSVKEAVQSGWSNIFETTFGDYEEAKVLWTDLANTLYDIFAGDLGGINDLLKGGLSSGWKRFLDQGNMGIGNAEEFKAILIHAYDEAAKEGGESFDELIKKHGSFAEVLKTGVISADMLANSVDTMAETYNNLSEAELKEQGISEFTIARLNRLNEAMKDGSVSADEWAKAFTETSGRENLTKSLFNVLDALFKVDEETGKAIGIISIFKEAISNIFPPMASERIYAITERIEGFTRSLILSEEKADKLRRVFEGVLSVFKSIKTILSQVIKFGFEKLAGLFPKVFGSIQFDFLEMAARAGDALSGLSKWFEENNVIEIGMTKLGERIDLLKTKFDAFIVSLQQSPIIQSVVEKLSPVIESVQETFDSMIAGLDENSTLGGIINGLSENLAKLGSIKSWTPTTLMATLTGLVQSAFEGFTNLNSLWNVMGTGATAMIKGIGNAAEGTGKSLQKAGSSIAGFFGSVVDAVRENINIVQILTVAAGVALLKYAKAITDLVGSLNVIGTFASVFTGLKQRFQSEAMLNAAKALAILAGVVAGFALLAKTHTKELWASVAVLFVISAIFAGLVFLNEKLNSAPAFEFGKLSFNVSPFVFALIGFIASIKMLAYSLKTMYDMNLSASGFAGLLIQIAFISAVVIALYELTLWINKKAKMSAETAKDMFAIVGLVAALRIAVYALKSLSDMAKSLDGGTVLRTIGLLIPVIIALMAVQKLSSGMKFGAGAGLLLAVGSIFALVLILEHLAKQPIGEIRSVMPVFIDVMKYVALLLAASMFAGEHALGAGAMMAGIGASLLLIVRAMKSLEEISTEDLQKVKPTIFELLGVFGLLLIASKFSGENAMKAGVMLLMMSGTLLILTGVLLILQAIPAPDLTKATAAIGSLMLIFAAIIFASAYTENAYKSIMAISSTILILGFMIAALTYFARDDLGALNESVKALAILLLSLAGVFIAFGFVSKESEKLDMGAIAKTFLGLASVILSLLAVVGIVAILNTIPIEEGLTEKAIVLAGLLAVCTGITLLLSKFGGSIDVGAVVKGAAAVAGFLASMEVFLGLIGALTLGINNLYGGDGKAVEHALDESIIVLTKIGEAIGAFVGGIVGAFIDEAVLGTLDNFATHIVSFSEEMAKFNTDSVEKAKSALALFALFGAADLWTSITSAVGGVFELIGDVATGNIFGKKQNKFQVFADNLKILGTALHDFDEALGSGFRSYATKQASEAIGLLFDAFHKIPNEGGIAKLFAGDNSLNDFLKTDSDGNTVLTRLATAIVSFQRAITECPINPDEVKNATTALGYITDFANSIPNEGGLLGAIVGNNDMDVFASQLDKFLPKLPMIGHYMARLSANAEGADMALIQSMGTELSRWIEFAKGIAHIDATKLPSFAEALANTAKTGIEGFFGRITENFEAVYEKTGEFISRAISGINDKAPDMALAMNALVLTMTLALGSDENIAKFHEVGSNVAQGFIDGIESRIDDVGEAAERLAEAAEDALTASLDIRSPSKVFESFGEFTGEGFANGLASMADNVKSAATTIGEKAKEGITNGIAGIKDVIQNGIGEVDFSNGVVSGLKDAAGNLKEYFLAKSGIGDLDMTKLLGADFTSPNIDLNSLGAEDLTPVLDLNNAIEQAGNLDNLMSFWQASDIDNAFKDQELGMEDYQNGVNPFGTTYNFTQNNYSPKALSREEIYRQTRNQFALMKGSVR